MKRMNNHYGKDVFRGARCVMPLDLQFFAEDGSGDDGAAGSGGGGASGDGGNAGKTPEGEKGGESSGMSFDDFLKDPKNQAEFDRRVGKALETNKTKMQADIDARIEAAKTEAEKMAKMNAEQKAQYEREKKEAELQAREAEITKRELMATAKEQLAEKNLPLSLSAVLNYTSAEECTASIDAVEKAFQEAVEAGVESRLAGGKPPKKAPEGAGNTLEAQVLKAMKGE